MKLRGSHPRIVLSRAAVLRRGAVLLLVCLFAPFLWQTPPPSCALPRSFSAGPTAEPDCPRAQPSLSLDDDSFCTGPCKADCFPRVRNICFSAKKVRLCTGQGRGHRNESSLFGRSQLSTFMRFNGERLTVGVEAGECDEGWHWMDGLAAVADQRFLPYQKPNPHHEAEKLIPALLLARSFGSMLHWFSTRAEVSEWAKGFLVALGMEEKVRYHTLPARDDDSICFRDAVLLSSPTNLRYVPDEGTNQWLRERALEHCGLPPANSSWPLGRALILDRWAGPRRFGNRPEIGSEVAEMFRDTLVEHKLSGLGSFCEQVAPVAGADLLVVPHGSQNVVMLFARPGAVVVEVFPFLYHTNALRNFTHAAQLKMYSVLGRPPPGDWQLRFFSNFGWDFCHDKLRWCKNHARTQPIYADLLELRNVLGLIQRAKGSVALRPSTRRMPAGWDDNFLG